MTCRQILAALIASLSLGACSDWPDTGLQSDAARNAPWPRLVPISDVLAVPADRIAEGDTEALVARAAALRARADILRQPVAGDAAFEAMRQRLSGN